MSLWDRILYKGKSPISGEIKVTENSGIRRLVIGGFTQSQSLRPDGYTGQYYWDKMVPEGFNLEKDSRVLILGLGGGTIAKIITRHAGPVTIDGVEIDPVIVELAKKYFSLNEPNINIIIADAKDFVKDARFKYNLICVDLFISDKVPPGVETTEFLERVRGLLKESGVVMINKIFNGKKELEDYQNFVRQIFPKVGFFIVRGNVETDNVIVTAEG